MAVVSIVAAMDRHRAIGVNGDLPWHLPEDLKFFKKTTSGGTIIMGRKTYESIGRPLPKRENIVVTRDDSYEADGVIVVGSIDAAVAAASRDNVFIIGGGQIYAQSLDLADYLILTLVDTVVEGADTFFPEVVNEDWLFVSESRQKANKNNAFDMHFVVLKKNYADR